MTARFFSDGPAPTGTVEFRELPACAFQTTPCPFAEPAPFATVTIANGQASTTIEPAIGPHHYQAAYSGDSRYPPLRADLFQIIGAAIPVLGRPTVLAFALALAAAGLLRMLRGEG